jgi:hypothetical protein
MYYWSNITIRDVIIVISKKYKHQFMFCINLLSCIGLVLLSPDNTSWIPSVLCIFATFYILNSMHYINHELQNEPYVREQIRNLISG